MVKRLNISEGIKWIFDNPIPNTIFSVIISFILIFILRKSSKTDDKFSLKFDDFDYGYDLCATAILSTFMNIRADNFHTGGWFLFLLLIVPFFSSELVRGIVIKKRENFKKLDKEQKNKIQKSIKRIEILIPLGIGTVCLIISCLYIGGAV